MTVEAHPVAREGKMVKGEFVTTSVTVFAYDDETDLTGEGVADTDDKALDLALAHLKERNEWLAKKEAENG